MQSTMTRPARAPGARETEPRQARALLSQAVDAFREGRAQAAPPLQTGLSDGQLNDELLAYVFGRLDVSDHSSLQKVGSVRERALALSREGRQDEAEASMKLARFFLSAAGFSPLGRTAADTLHHAAEAYLLYRRGDWAQANARMAAAVDATDRLADAWGESLFSTARRVHLLHNLMKVEARRGAAREAVSLGAGILAHLTAASTHPSAVTTRTPVALDAAIASNFCNSVTITIAEVLAAVPNAEAAELLALVDGLEPAEPAPGVRAWDWFRLKSAALADDPRPFLEGAATFLRAGYSRAKVLWYAVALDVVRVARRMDADDAVSDIVAELSAAPKLPATFKPVLTKAAA